MNSLIITTGIIAFVAMVAYHMVRPIFQKLRLSIAAFIPDPPKSDSKEKRFRLGFPRISKPFLIRFFMFLTALLGLFPFLSIPFNGDFFESNTVRIIVDISPSMAVSDGNGNRLDSANSVLKETLETLEIVNSVTCIEILTVGDEVLLFRKGITENLLGTKIPDSLADDGAGVQILTTSIQIEMENSCESAPLQAIVITDQPPVAVGQNVFSGRLIWYQVGAPIQNQAVSSARVVGGGLLGGARLRINVQYSGGNTTNSKLILTGPNGITEPALFQDSEAKDSWYAEIVSPVKGEYQARINPGGALPNDDILHFSVPEIERISVDWRIEDISRPVSLVDDSLSADIIVAPLDSIQEIANHESVLTYDTQWQSDEAIGIFQHRHPLLKDINFDVFENNSPDGLSQLPSGFVPVVAGLNRSIWVAVSEDSRTVIVPSLGNATTEDQSALATTLFFNALDWVSKSKQKEIEDSYWKTTEGKRSTNIIAEFDTYRELSTPPVLTDLALPVQETTERVSLDEQFENLEWLLLVSMILLLLDRIFGLKWRHEN